MLEYLTARGELSTICGAEYAKLAMEPNTMPQVRDRYLRIAPYYRELAETEPASSTGAKRENVEASAS
jgi:hypothetical protein